MRHAPLSSCTSYNSSYRLAEYIIVITGREQRGELFGHPVYRASEFDILPLDPTVSVSSPPHPVEAHLLALVRSHLNSGVFLFSYGYDVTRRLQAQWVAQEQDQGRAFWESVRFMIFIHIDTTSMFNIHFVRLMTGFSGTSERLLFALLI